MIKVITDLRRAGKSYLLFHLFKDELIKRGITQDQMIEIPLGDDAFRSCRNPENLYAFIINKMTDSSRMYYVMIDEAQFAISSEELKKSRSSD